MTPPNVTALDKRLAAPMFWVTVLFLTLFAGVLHPGNDVTDEAVLSANAGSVTQVTTGTVDSFVPEARMLSLMARSFCLWGMLLLFPLFPIEAVLHSRKHEIGRAAA